MIKKLGLFFMGLAIFFSCAQKQAEESGGDLTLTSKIMINNLPYLGQVNVKQTQMLAGQIMRATYSTSFPVGAEVQEINSTFLINLDEKAIYLINDADSMYVRLSLAEFDSLTAGASAPHDSLSKPLRITNQTISKKAEEKQVIGQFGECVPVDFALTMEGGTPEGYRGDFKGRIWTSSALPNSQVYTRFQDQAMALSKSAAGGNPGVFGLAGKLNIDEAWLAELGRAVSGIPVLGEFEISMPMAGETLNYNIKMELTEYAPAKIDGALLEVPGGYRQVAFADFRMY